MFPLDTSFPFFQKSYFLSLSHCYYFSEFCHVFMSVYKIAPFTIEGEKTRENRREDVGREIPIPNTTLL